MGRNVVLTCLLLLVGCGPSTLAGFLVDGKHHQKFQALETIKKSTPETLAPQVTGEDIPNLRRAISQGEPWFQAAALKLARALKAPELIPDLLQAAAAQMGFVRSAALRTLAAYDASLTRAELLKSLKSGDGKLRSAAIRAAARIPAPEVLPVLTKLAASGNHETSTLAFGALLAREAQVRRGLAGKLPRSKGCPSAHILALAADADESVKAGALTALLKCSASQLARRKHEVRAHLPAALARGGEKGLVQATRLAAKTKDPALIPAVAALLEHDNARVRAAAAAALLRYGAAARTALVSALTNPKGGDIAWKTLAGKGLPDPLLAGKNNGFQRLWEGRFKSRPYPGLLAGTLLFRDAPTRVLLTDSRTGAEQGKATLESLAATGVSHDGLALTREGGTQVPTLQAAGLKKGTRLWSFAHEREWSLSVLRREPDRILLQGFTKSGNRKFLAGIVALNPTTGGILWETELEGSTAHFARGVVFVADGRKLTVLDGKNGKKLWDATVGKEEKEAKSSVRDQRRSRVRRTVRDENRIRFIDGTSAQMVLVTTQNLVTAMDPAFGKISGELAVPGAILQAPVQDDKTVYVSYLKETKGEEPAPSLLALDKKSGEVSWEWTWDPPTWLRGETVLPAQRLFTTGRGVLLGCGEGVLLAWQTDTGEEKWVVQTGIEDCSFRAPIVTDHAIYLWNRDNQVMAVDPVDGRTLWKDKLAGTLSRLVLADGRVLLAASTPKGGGKNDVAVRAYLVEEAVALRVLAGLEDGTRLKQLAAHGSPAVRRHAVEALGRLGTKSAPRLMEALNDPKAKVRYEAMKGLAAAKHKPAVEALLNLVNLQGDDATHVARALEAIDPGWINHKLVPGEVRTIFKELRRFRRKYLQLREECEKQPFCASKWQSLKLQALAEDNLVESRELAAATLLAEAALFDEAGAAYEKNDPKGAEVYKEIRTLPVVVDEVVYQPLGGPWRPAAREMWRLLSLSVLLGE